MSDTIYDFTVQDIHGNEHDMGEFRGQVLLIVNTASKCGFTPQFEGLQALHGELGDKGLKVLGFPCNQFARQSPESAEQFCAFGEREFGVTFPLMEKVEVNGAKAHPLFKRLKAVSLMT